MACLPYSPPQEAWPPLEGWGRLILQTWRSGTGWEATVKAQNGTQDPTQLAHRPPSSWGTWAGLWVWAGPPYCREVKSSFLPAPPEYPLLPSSLRTHPPWVSLCLLLVQTPSHHVGVCDCLVPVLSCGPTDWSVSSAALSRKDTPPQIKDSYGSPCPVSCFCWLDTLFPQPLLTGSDFQASGRAWTGVSGPIGFWSCLLHFGHSPAWQSGCHLCGPGLASVTEAVAT